MVFAAVALSQAVTLTATVDETLSFTDNFALAPSSAGVTTASVTNVGLNFATANQTSVFSLYAATDMVYRHDPGGSSSFTGFNPNINATYDVTGQTTTFSLGASYSDAPINFQTTPPGVTIPPGGSSTVALITSTANQRNYGANVNLGYQVNATNVASTSLDYTKTDYDAGATSLFDDSTWTAAVGWTHDFDNRLVGSLNGQYSVFKSADPTASEARTTSINASATWQQTNNLTLDGGAGLSFTSQDLTGGTTDSTNFDAQVGFTYVLSTGNISGSYSRSLSPGTSGGLLQTDAFAFSGVYNVNTSSSVNLNVDYTQDRSLSGSVSTSAVLSINPVYSVSLTPSVSAQAGYTYTNSDSGASNASSHRIEFNLVKTFQLKP